MWSFSEQNSVKPLPKAPPGCGVRRGMSPETDGAQWWLTPVPSPPPLIWNVPEETGLTSEC